MSNAALEMLSEPSSRRLSSPRARGGSVMHPALLSVWPDTSCCRGDAHSPLGFPIPVWREWALKVSMEVMLLVLSSSCPQMLCAELQSHESQVCPITPK